MLGIRNGVVDKPRLIDASIASGLRAKLQTGNLLTGQLFISLDLYEDGVAGALVKNSDGVTIIPSVPSDLKQVTEGVTQALAKINALPLEELITNANSTVARAGVLLSQFEKAGLAAQLSGTIGSAEKAITQYSRLASSARGELNSLSSQLQRFVTVAGDSMEGIAPDSPLYYNLLNTLKDVQAASRAVLAVSESVEKKPEIFLFGK